MTSVIDLDAVGQADMIRRGEVSPAELVDQALARVDALDPELNAVIHRMDDKARAQAARTLPDAPFGGVPMVLKDLTAASAGDPFHEGMKMRRAIGFRAEADTFLVAKLRAAGFVFVGRTNVPEFGLVPSTEPEAYGPAKNPWDTERSPGGSSGGSAAAVASGMVAVGHANDGGGSIRIPAAVCGLVGFKPTRGLVSLGPDYGEVWAGFECDHVLTRTVRDCAAALDVLAGPMPGDPYFALPPAGGYRRAVGAEAGSLRVGVLRSDPSGSTTLHPDCLGAVDSTAAVLGELGHRVEEAFPARLADPAFIGDFITTYLAYAEWCLEDSARVTGRPVGPEDCEAFTWTLAEMSRAVTPGKYLAAVRSLQEVSRGIRAWWETEGWDLLLTPTIPEPPWLLGQFGSPPDNPLAPMFRAATIVPFTAPFNATGQPAVSLPLHWNDDGLPIGVQLVGAYGRDDLLLSVCAQLEAARPWDGRRPPVHGAAPMGTAG